MRTLLILVGMQGAGKTTALRKVVGALVIKPSTQRQPRFPEEDEYHFETEWNEPLFAWTIQRAGSNYGMRHSELEAVRAVGVTVFDPTNIAVLEHSNLYDHFEIVTVGLDTLHSLDVQHQRVGNDPSRMLGETSFIQQRAVIQNCDVVLSGNESVIGAAVNEIALILGGRGGTLSGQSIKKLLAAGTLLEGANQEHIEAASYDLHLADKYWCQGKYRVMTDADAAVIPPYSFVLVQAREQAVMPRFIAGTFDIRVHLFFSGVVLSNGPQIDPGYRGALFCMLYNASSTPVGLNQGDHFATIQFDTTAINSVGYRSHYQGKKTFNDFLDGSSAQKPGGTILEVVRKLESELKKELSDFKNHWWAAAAVMSGILLGIVAISYTMIDKITDKGAAAVEKINDAVVKVDSALERMNQGIEKLKAVDGVTEFKKSRKR